MISHSFKVKRPKLTSYQRDFLYCPERFSVTEASTKTGKTFAHIFWLYEIAHGYEDGKKIIDVKEGWEYWWVAPVYSQSEIAFLRMWRKLKRVKGYSANLSKLYINTPVGTIIRFKTARDPDTLYGEDVHAAVFDEFTRAKKEAWYALRSTLTATKAKCKFIGNYKGKSNWGHQLGLKAKIKGSEYAYFKVTAYDAVDAGILDADEVEQARKDLPSVVFKALYLAEGDLDEARLLSDANIADLKTNTFVEEGPAYITADIALHGSDRFVVGVWKGMVLVEIIVRDKIEADEVEALLKSTAEKWGVQRSKICYDSDGLGTYLKSYLKGAIPFVNNATPIEIKKTKEQYKNLKSQCYFRFAKSITDGKYFFKADLSEYWEDIVEELECIKNRGDETKLSVLQKKEIKALIGRSPDFSDMLMMREWFELKPKTSWVDQYK